jgi:hypothetical protein
MALTLSNMPASISFPGALDYLSISGLPGASSSGIKRLGREDEYALPSIVIHPVPFTECTGYVLFFTLPVTDYFSIP